MGARLTCNSRPFSFRRGKLFDGPTLLASQGFHPDRMDLSDFDGSRGALQYGLLAGNCMAIPCIGACITAGASDA